MPTLVCTTRNEVMEAVTSRSGQIPVMRRVNRPVIVAFIDIDVYHEAIRRHREQYTERLIKERTT